jgi:hypothetical protein
MATLQTALRLASFASNSTLAIGGLAPKAFGVMHSFFHDRISHLGLVYSNEMRWEIAAPAASLMLNVRTQQTDRQ